MPSHDLLTKITRTLDLNAAALIAVAEESYVRNQIGGDVLDKLTLHPDMFTVDTYWGRMTPNSARPN